MSARVPEELDVERLNAEGRRASCRDSSRERYERLRGQRLCVRGASHGPAADGFTLCEPCRVDVREDQRDRYRHTRAVSRVNSCGLCGSEQHTAKRCAMPPEARDPGDSRRLERNREYKALLRLQGKCIANPAHERPIKGRARCEACNAKRRKGGVS